MNVPTPLQAGIGHDLALAILHATSTPVLLLDTALVVVAASASFGRTFGLHPGDLAGRRLAELGVGEWNHPQLGTLLRATATGAADVDTYELALQRDGHTPMALVLAIRRLAYGPGQPVRLLLSATDVTATRQIEALRDETMRENALLMRELQHRVANSLQVIASVLLQNARNVQSDESRLHLRDAHHRVMSVAALQRQLSVTLQETVEVRAYLTQLCESIGASMIADRGQTALNVMADDATTRPEASVSLGLIVTELVINALKHAFPDYRRGSVQVEYRTEAAGWRLRVTDDGVGMSAGPDRIAGLGTSIVQALARQMKATVSITDAGPGTDVHVTHGAFGGAAAQVAATQPAV